MCLFRLFHLSNKKMILENKVMILENKTNIIKEEERCFKQISYERDYKFEINKKNFKTKSYERD